MSSHRRRCSSGLVLAAFVCSASPAGETRDHPYCEKAKGSAGRVTAVAGTFPEGAGGASLAIHSHDLADLLFASILPGVTGRPSVLVSGTRLLITAAGTDPGERTIDAVLGGYLAKPAGDQNGFLLLAVAGSSP